MGLNADEVYRAGLELDVDERTVVAHRLLASLHEGDGGDQAEIDTAWREEIRVRVDGILSGEVETVPWDAAITEIRAALGDPPG